jgi:hypothetical protein
VNETPTRILIVIAVAGIGLALFLLLTSCQPAPELLPRERAAHWAAITAWKEAGLPPMRYCSVDTLRLRRGDCGEGMAACLRWDRGQPVVQLAPWQQLSPDGEPIIHELMHAQFHCSKLHGWNSGANYFHHDPRVWAASGGAESVQAIARSMY